MKNADVAIACAIGTLRTLEQVRGWLMWDRHIADTDLNLRLATARDPLETNMQVYHEALAVLLPMNRLSGDLTAELVGAPPAPTKGPQIKAPASPSPTPIADERQRIAKGERS